jgi:hypothetical protein
MILMGKKSNCMHSKESTFVNFDLKAFSHSKVSTFVNFDPKAFITSSNNTCYYNTIQLMRMHYSPWLFISKCEDFTKTKFI